MASNLFSLGKCLFKSVDGKGKVYEAFNSPAAQVLATKRARGDVAEIALYTGYYSAKFCGIFGPMGFEPTGNDEKDLIDFYSKYSIALQDLTDDGKPVPDGEDENPTDAS